MSRIRHFAAALAGGLPILATGLIVNTVWGSIPSWLLVVFWVFTVVVVELGLWVSSGQVLQAASNALVVAPREVPLALRELAERAESHREESERLAGRLEDLSSSLGDGLLVVTSDLRVRLINQPALA